MITPEQRMQLVYTSKIPIALFLNISAISIHYNTPLA